MSKVTAPLLSFGASGQIAKTQVYSTWKGIPYARRHVVPANPRSVEQTSTRSVFTFLNAVWKVAPEDFRAAWSMFVKGQPLTDRNAFVSKNLGLLRPNDFLDGIVLSPGAKGGLTGDVVVTPGAGDLVITGVPPSPLPSGWTVTRFIAAAILEQDPHLGVEYDVVSGSDTTSPYSVTLTGLAAGSWVAGGWFEYQKSALATDLAYGPETGAAYTVT